MEKECKEAADVLGYAHTGVKKPLGTQINTFPFGCSTCEPTHTPVSSIYFNFWLMGKDKKATGGHSLCKCKSEHLHTFWVHVQYFGSVRTLSDWHACNIIVNAHAYIHAHINPAHALYLMLDAPFTICLEFTRIKWGGGGGRAVSWTGD